MMVTAHYDLSRSGGTCAGLAMDMKNNILFAASRMPSNMVILSATDGKIITTIPINGGTDGALFNPNTMEAFSSHSDGTLVVIKENSPTNSRERVFRPCWVHGHQRWIARLTA